MVYKFTVNKYFKLSEKGSYKQKVKVSYLRNHTKVELYKLLLELFTVKIIPLIIAMIIVLIAKNKIKKITNQKDNI